MKKKNICKQNNKACSWVGPTCHKNRLKTAPSGGASQNELNGESDPKRLPFSDWSYVNVCKGWNYMGLR